MFATAGREWLFAYAQKQTLANEVLHTWGENVHINSLDNIRTHETFVVRIAE